MDSMFTDIMKAFKEQKKPQLDFIWPGFLAGAVGMVVAPGATGKSFWALEAAMSVACDVPGGDLVGLKPQRAGRVVYWSSEDPAPILVQRVHAIGQYLDPAARQAIAKNLVLKPIMGLHLNIMDDRQLSDVVTICAGARLIVLDSLSRIHRLDENSNSDMMRLIVTLEYIATHTGAAVLFLHHVSKASVRGGYIDRQQAARGASALVDSVSWSGFMAKMTEAEALRLSDRVYGCQPIGSDRRDSFVRFGVSKQSHDDDVIPFNQWYERRNGGVLVPVELTEINGWRRVGSSRRAYLSGAQI